MNTFFEDTNNTPTNEAETELDVISGGEAAETDDHGNSESLSGFLEFLARMSADLPSISDIDDDDDDDEEDGDAETDASIF